MSERDDVSAAVYAAILAFGLASWPLAVVVHAWAVATLWRWALVPMGLPAITWAGAATLGGLAALLTHQIPWDWADESLSRAERAKRVLAKGLALPGRPALILGFTYVAMLVLGWIQ